MDNGTIAELHIPQIETQFPRSVASGTTSPPDCDSPPHVPLSPKSTFNFSWVPEPQILSSPTHSSGSSRCRSSGSSSFASLSSLSSGARGSTSHHGQGYRCGFGALQRSLVGPNAGTATATATATSSPTAATAATTPRACSPSCRSLAGSPEPSLTAPGSLMGNTLGLIGSKLTSIASLQATQTPPASLRCTTPPGLGLGPSSHSTSSSTAASPTPSFSSSALTSVPTSAPSSSLSTPVSRININTKTPTAPPFRSSGSSSSPTGVLSISSATTSPTSPTSISPRSTRPPINVKMPPRPAKRSADGSGASDDDANVSGAGKLKLARSDRGPEDFSSVVKNRLQSYTRTGQACDRCKVRKIRCDALPEGCSHCINLNLECYVTDRVTGRTERRGYMQQLEREKNSMMSRIRDLEKLCADRGIEVKPFQGGVRAQSPPDTVDDEMGNASSAAESNSNAVSNEGWSQYGSLWIKDSSSPKPANNIIRFKTPRNEWQTRPEQSRWGVGADDAPLSSLKGMTLTLLGTTIETTAFEAPDVDEPLSVTDPSMPLYNKSVQAFLRSTMGVNPPVRVELPTRENAFMYAEWYFITIASFVPLLHKPTFMKLLTRVYDEPGFKASVPELVLVHMVFAIILFQFGVRNSQTLEQRNNFNDLSNKHYHFALSKMYEIFSSTEFEALQALVLVASHTRAFPKPGSGSIVASMALHRALELNYHRRTKKPGEPTDLKNELRKRAWWNMMTVVVDINGKRGYPLPLSVQDFDVDFPEPIADELLSDDGVDTSRTLPCPYEVAIAGFKCIPMYMEMYANIFSVRRDESNYKNIVAALEAQMNQWEAELPSSMRLNPPKKHDHEMVGPLFARTFMLEFRLHVRHPSLAMTTDQEMIAENTRICENAAREYLETVEHLSKMKALDTTWHQMSVYCVAILSMLVPQWERRFEITPEEVTKLREEMERWMNVVKEMSALLGCGSGTSNQIAQLINRTMAWIEHDMPQKEMKSAIRTHANMKQEQQLPLQNAGSLAPPISFGGSTSQHPSISSAGPSQTGDVTKNFYTADGTATAHATYPSLAYVEQPAQPNAQATASYQHDQTGMFYPTTTATAGTAHPASHSQSDPLVNYASEAGQHLSHHNPDMMWRSSWQNWSAAIADSQERYSANALMTLGGADASRSAVITPIMAGNGIPHAGGELPMVPQPASWPLIMFDQTPQE